MLNLSIRNQSEERGLLKIDGEPLPQRIVKDWVARLITEICNDDRVPLRKPQRSMETDEINRNRS